MLFAVGLPGMEGVLQANAVSISLTRCGGIYRGMSWVQVNLLARGLSRGWGSICRTALSGTPFAQVMHMLKNAQAGHFWVEKGRLGLYSPPLRIRLRKLKVVLDLPVLVVGSVLGSMPLLY